MSFLIADKEVCAKVDAICRKFVDKFTNKKAERATQIGKKSEHSLNTIILFEDGSLWTNRVDSITKYAQVVNPHWYNFFEGLEKLGLLTKQDLKKIKVQIDAYDRTQKEIDIRRSAGAFVRKVGKNKALEYIRHYNSDMELADELYAKFRREYQPDNDEHKYYFYKGNVGKWLRERRRYNELTIGRQKEIDDYFFRRIRDEHGIG
jgi:hypothetical protein